MRTFTGKKAATALALTAVAVTGTGVAYAYWSTSGNGSGTAATSTPTANLEVKQTTVLTPMFPGDVAQTISGTVKNLAANSAYVAKVVVSIDSVTQATGATGTCVATDYTLLSPSMTVAKDIAKDATETFTGATLQFNNKITNQDGCKGATVNLAYAAS